GPSSLVNSFALKPEGPGFELIDRDKFVERPVATDIEFGPDCAAYITDWDSSFVKAGHGRIFRIAAPDLQKSDAVLQTKKLLNEGMSKRDAKELQSLLAHRDMRVRQAAQFELAARGLASSDIFVETATSSEQRLARIHAIWGLGQLARKDPKVLAPLIPLLNDKDDEIRAQAARVLGDAASQDALAAMIKLTADPSPRVRYFAAMGLGKIARPEAVGPVLKMLAANAEAKDTYVRHAGVMALAGIGDTSALLSAAKDDSPVVRMGVVLALRRLKRTEVAMFLKDSQPAIVIEA